MSVLAERTPIYKNLSVNLLTIGLLTLLLYVGQSILVPLLFAILLASLLLPVAKFLQRIGIPKVVSILLSLFMSIVVLASIIYFLASQIGNFLDDLPTISERLDKLTAELQKWITETFNVGIRKQNQYLNQAGLKEKASPVALLGQTVITITQLVSYLVLLPVYTFLLLYYKDLIKKFLVDVFKNGGESEVREVLHESQFVAQGYITGLLIEFSIVFALNSTGFLILGIKYALFLALVAALLNLIPYIGMLVANGFCMLITLISSEEMNMSMVLWVAAVLAIVQFIDNNFLMPLIVGSRVRINSLVTIVGVLVGGALCGVPGMFLAIPGLAVLKVIFDRAPGLKPFGMLLGDDSTKPQTKKKIIPKKVV
jgi:predicted PurR-regulated permease PerM